MDPHNQVYQRIEFEQIYKQLIASSQRQVEQLGMDTYRTFYFCAPLVYLSIHRIACSKVISSCFHCFTHAFGLVEILV